MNSTVPIIVECFSCNTNQIFLFPNKDFLTALECQFCFQLGVIYEGKLFPIDNVGNLSSLDQDSVKEYLIDTIIRHSYKEFNKYIRERYSSRKRTPLKRKSKKITLDSAMLIVGKIYSKDEKGLREIEDDYFDIGIKVNSIQKAKKEIPKDLQKQFKTLKFLYEAFKKFIE